MTRILFTHPPLAIKRINKHKRNIHFTAPTDKLKKSHLVPRGPETNPISYSTITDSPQTPSSSSTFGFACETCRSYLLYGGGLVRAHLILIALSDILTRTFYLSRSTTVSTK